MNKANSEPTDKMVNVLEVISNFIDDEGYPPSIRDLCDLCFLKSTSTVHQYLDRLESRELIIRIPKVNRGLTITEKGKNILKQKNLASAENTN
ncbi:LexA family protein [Vagococcus carniphilus]|uniref:LexA family protein n=1 Tax=Vagococcus carniphilus TaxID=218144 RepID=UPI003BAB0C0D